MKILSILLLLISYINNATAKELRTLKGIGEKRAKAIVEYRKMRCFKTINDLVKVRGIGKKTAEKNRDSITVGECKKE